MSFSRKKNKRGSLAKQLSSLFPSKNPFVNVDQIAIITKRYSLIMLLIALRKLFFFFLFFFTFSIYGVAQTASVDIGRVYYTDSVHNESNKLMPVKRKSSSYFSSNSKETVSSRLGNFIATYDDNYFMTEGVKHCLKLAMDLWEELLIIEKPVKFHVTISENMNPDVAIKTIVTYTRNSKGLALPDNLFAQQTSKYIQCLDTIKINANIDWSSSWLYDDSDNGNISLTSGFLRHIAHVLGFGCSVVNRTSGLGFAVPNTPSAFDRLVFNGQSYLSQMKDMNQISSFFSKDTKLKSGSFVYDLYDAACFIQGRSAVYFSLGYENLLEYPIHNSKKLMSVNHETLNVLHEIGWGLKKHDKSVVSLGTNVVGYGTVYMPNQFIIKDTSSNKQLPALWRYQLYNNTTHNYENKMEYSGSVFSLIPVFTEKNLDEYNCVQARIVAEVEGENYSFPLTLETRPYICDVVYSNIESVDDRHYQFDINIRQQGASRGIVSVSDDTGSIHQYNYDGKNIHVQKLVKGYDAYIDLSLENDYGVTSRLYPIKFNYFLSDFNNLAAQTIFEHSDWKKKYAKNNNNVLRDKDSLRLSIDRFEEIDSVKWYLYIGSENKEICSKGNDAGYTFVVTAENFDCLFSRSGRNNNILVQGGSSWDYAVWSSDDSCHFEAEVFIHKDEEAFIKRLKSKSYALRVLPTEPVTEVLRTWVEDEDKLNPFAKIRIDNLNDYDYLAIWVTDTTLDDPIYGHAISYCDTIIDAGNGNEFVINPGGWTNLVWCSAYNEYGWIDGEKVGLTPTSICEVVNKGPSVRIVDRLVKVSGKNDFILSIYSMNGSLVGNSGKCQNYQQELSPGCYILKLQNYSCRDSFIKVLIK